MLRLGGFDVIVFDLKCLNVIVHAEAARSEDIVPCKIDAGKFNAHPVGGDCVGFSEGRKQMVGVAFTLILDSKVVYDQYNKDYLLNSIKR